LIRVVEIRLEIHARYSCWILTASKSSWQSKGTVVNTRISNIPKERSGDADSLSWIELEPARKRRVAICVVAINPITHIQPIDSGSKSVPIPTSTCT
jgi:hypothetical protein